MITRNRAVRSPPAAREFTAEAETLRAKILDLVEEFCHIAHGIRPFVPGISDVPVSGKVYGPEELRALTDAALDFWLTTGRYNSQFEKQLAEILGVRHLLTVN